MDDIEGIVEISGALASEPTARSLWLLWVLAVAAFAMVPAAIGVSLDLPAALDVALSFAGILILALIVSIVQRPRAQAKAQAGDQAPR